MMLSTQSQLEQQLAMSAALNNSYHSSEKSDESANSSILYNGHMGDTPTVSFTHNPTLVSESIIVTSQAQPAASPAVHTSQDVKSSQQSRALGTGDRPEPSAEYLAQLLKDKKQMQAFPSVFQHVERLLDEEIKAVRVSLFKFAFNEDQTPLPQPIGDVVTLTEKVFVPQKEYPEYNFVGRILGPRGMTAKQLEQECGCKIMVRGRGSMRDKKKEEANRGKPNWEHLNEDLHVLIQCEDTENRAKIKLARAKEEVKKLLVPAPEGEDELKRKQLMELAIINGTYRTHTSGQKTNTSANDAVAAQLKLLGAQMGLQSAALRQPSVAGAPLIMSPQRSQALNTQLTTVSASTPQLNQQLLAQQLLMGSGMDLTTQQMLLGNFVQPDAATLQQQALMAQVSMANAQFMPQLGIGYEQADLKSVMLQQPRTYAAAAHPYKQ